MFQKPVRENTFAVSENPHPAHEHEEVETVVGPSVNVEGDFSSEGNILVKGTVSGSVKTSRLLTVEAGAKILANVRAGNALVSGQIKGNMKVDDRLELTATAQVLGDVSCTTLVISAGALLAGKVTMKGINIEGPKTERRGLLGRSKFSDNDEEGEEVVTV